MKGVRTGSLKALLSYFQRPAISCFPTGPTGSWEVGSHGRWVGREGLSACLPVLS